MAREDPDTGEAARLFRNRDGLLGAWDDRARRDALEILAAGVRAADPYRAVREALRLDGGTLRAAGRGFDLSTVNHVLVLGAGKAVISMARAVHDLLAGSLGSRLYGIVNADERTATAPVIDGIEVIPASHPLPNDPGMEGARRILDLAKLADAQELILVLLSGGASALLPLPETGVSLEHKRLVTRMLKDASGATIEELNCVRKHLSAIKGGKLARAAAPAAVVTLIISDVIGDPIDAIGSGPTAPDPTTCGDACQILIRHGVWDRLPDGVRGALEQGRFETLKEGDQAFTRVFNSILLTNAEARDAMSKRAARLGYEILSIAEPVRGIARIAGPRLLEEARRRIGTGRPAAVVAGGETTVRVHGTGRGGRNQEMALAVLERLAEGELFAAMGTDGTDGESDAAGAIADQAVAHEARRLGLDPLHFLAANDSATFFELTNGQLVTGATGTNVADVELVLIQDSSRKRA